MLRLARPSLPLRRPAGRSRAFTLVEVMIASTIGAGVLAGVLSSFLFLTRTGVRAAQYNDMQAQVRLGLEKFSEDVRMASAIIWNGNLSVTLTVPNNYAANGNQVTYAFDPDPVSASPTGKCFYYKPGDVSSTASRVVLVRNINDFLFHRYDRLDNETDVTNTSTKRLQVTFTARSTGITLTDSTETAISSSFILRNKPVN